MYPPTTPGTPCRTPFEQCMGSFMFRKMVNHEVLRDGAYGLSSLSEKTIESNHSVADVITKAALSTRLFKEPECWSGQGSNPQPPAP